MTNGHSTIEETADARMGVLGARDWLLPLYGPALRPIALPESARRIHPLPIRVAGVANDPERMELLMEYEDKNTYKASGFYAAPNEGTLNWRLLVKGTPLYRAAGICSSGEVGLFSILPSVRRKLVLVDHSYTSLNVAMTKYLLLVKLGAKEVHRLFTVGAHQEIHEAILGVRDQLPPEVAKSTGDYGASNWCSMSKTYDVYNNRIRRYELAERPVSTNYYFEEIQQHWKKHISLSLVQQACKKLHLVKFLHGDLQDLAEEGPFGLVYLSNALEHNNRDRKHPALSQVQACLKPGGYIIAAGWLHATSPYGVTGKGVYNHRTGQYDYPENKTVIEVKSCDSGRSNLGGGTLYWKQAMYQLAEPKAAVAA